MSESEKKPIGEIVWRDLTVPKAPKLRDFYQQVIGWDSVDHPMPAGEGHGAYSDFVMGSPGEQGELDAVAGICHAKGDNAKMPPAWVMYVRVADLEASIKSAVDLGGLLIDGPRNMGPGRMAVVRDPIGAVIGLWVD